MPPVSLPSISGRLEGLDLIRGLAVFGMVLVNFKFVMGADEAGPSWLVRAAGLFDGRAAATFVTLAGIGVAQMSRRAVGNGDQEALRQTRILLIKRSIFLLVVGLLHVNIWIADILHYYGIYLLVAASLLTASGAWLWGLSAAAMAAWTALFALLDYETGWDWENLEYDGLWTAAGMARNLLFNGFHPVVPWIAFLLIGLWIGRRDLSSAGERRKLLAWGAGTAALSELVTAALRRGLIWTGGGDDGLAWLAEAVNTESMPPTPFYMLAAGGAAVAAIALGLEAAERWRGRRWLEPFINAGQLALTLYLAHVIVGMGALECLERLEGQSLAFAAASATAFYACALAGSWLWRRKFERGPVEALMRRVCG